MTFAPRAAPGWTGTALATRIQRLRIAGPAVRLIWTAQVSGPPLVGIAPLFGPLLQDFQRIEGLRLFIHTTVIVTGGFIVWLRLYPTYPSSSLDGFACRVPPVAILPGHRFFAWPLAPVLLVAAALGSRGIVLICSHRRESARRLVPSRPMFILRIRPGAQVAARHR